MPEETMIQPLDALEYVQNINIAGIEFPDNFKPDIVTWLSFVAYSLLKRVEALESETHSRKSRKRRRRIAERVLAKQETE